LSTALQINLCLPRPLHLEPTRPFADTVTPHNAAAFAENGLHHSRQEERGDFERLRSVHSHKRWIHVGSTNHSLYVSQCFPLTVQYTYGASSPTVPRLTPARSSISGPEGPYFPVLILGSPPRRYRLVVSVGFHPRPPVRRLEHDAGRWAVLLQAGPAPSSRRAQLR